MTYFNENRIDTTLQHIKSISQSTLEMALYGDPDAFLEISPLCEELSIVPVHGASFISDRNVCMIGGDGYYHTIRGYKEIPTYSQRLNRYSCPLALLHISETNELVLFKYDSDHSPINSFHSLATQKGAILKTYVFLDPSELDGNYHLVTDETQKNMIFQQYFCSGISGKLENKISAALHTCDLITFGIKQENDETIQEKRNRTRELLSSAQTELIPKKEDGYFRIIATQEFAKPDKTKEFIAAATHLLEKPTSPNTEAHEDTVKQDTHSLPQRVYRNLASTIQLIAEIKL